MTIEEVIIKDVEKELLDLKAEILNIKIVNANLEARLNSIQKEFEKTVEPAVSEESEEEIMEVIFLCNLCDVSFESGDNLKEHKEKCHASYTNEDLKFSCEFCNYKSKSQKGVNIHKGSKHKNAQSLSTSRSITPFVSTSQNPINCIRHQDGCQDVLTFYYNEFTAICDSCSTFIEKKLKSTPFSHDICPCCHEPSNGIQLSLCSECLESIEDDGYAESSWGSWHLDRSRGQVICIGLDFEE